MNLTRKLLAVLLSISCVIANAGPWLFFRSLIQPSLHGRDGWVKGRGALIFFKAGVFDIPTLVLNAPVSVSLLASLTVVNRRRRALRGLMVTFYGFYPSLFTVSLSQVLLQLAYIGQSP